MTATELHSGSEIETISHATPTGDSVELPPLTTRGREFLTILNDVFDSLMARTAEEPCA